MSIRLVNIDRQTPMLLPVDMRDWIRKDDLVHYIVDAVERLPLKRMHVNHRGTGSEQFPPKMLLSLLIYCYARGVFSSREIERLTVHDLRIRYICANSHPDHSTIAGFRRENREAFMETFVKVLEMAQECKMLKVGTVAVDGTKIAANASRHSAVSPSSAVGPLASSDLISKEAEKS